MSEVDQIQARRDAEKRLWEQFYLDFPDLTDAKDIVYQVMGKEWSSLEHIEVKAALKQIGEKARKRISSLVDKRMPRVELPKVSQAVSPGNGETVTAPVQTKPVLNFAQQVKQNKSKRAHFR